MSVAILCSMCLWNKLEMVSATHFAPGVASYYDAGNEQDEPNVLVPVCAVCSAKWKNAMPFDQGGFDAYIEQERRCWNGAWRTPCPLPRMPSAGSCAHEKFETIAEEWIGSQPTVQRCTNCHAIRARASSATEFGAWLTPKPTKVSA